MEGLIPMVYKSLKKNKKRQTYECFSSGAAQTYDFYDYFNREQQHVMAADSVPGLRGAHHRRYNSVDMGRQRSFASEDGDVYKPKQLARFRSQRMFSCATGA
ncbi:hypothetical protein PHJA_000858900 [Phtheirospermum japonicum]|uniref:Uncharacterized protein n=1 Tax=Phtheirospermum japonicum TaxID=374723 RepID=A0A830BLU5_9LAMI|nr:hypothetical protein PHJA_000858900 [Phtheirospermum japonicum]